MVTKKLVLGAALLAVAGQGVVADEGEQGPFFEEITIIGTRKDGRDVNGAAHVIDSEVLREFVYYDIQRIVSRVPGVSIQLEDGYGLRPNISIRGVASERSISNWACGQTVKAGPAS